MGESKAIEVTRSKGERAAGEQARMPFVDVYETDSGLTVVAEMPGVDSQSVEVEVDKGVLTISGRAIEPDVEGYMPVYEGMISGGTFHRAFAMSDEVDRNKTTASFKDGVLTVVLPKAPEARSRKITVQAGQ